MSIITQNINDLMKVTQSCPTPATPWTVQFMQFSRPEYWSGQPFPSPGDLPNQGSNPGLLHCRQILYQLSNQGSPLTLWSFRNVVNPNLQGLKSTEQGRQRWRQDFSKCTYQDSVDFTTVRLICIQRKLKNFKKILKLKNKWKKQI